MKANNHTTQQVQPPKTVEQATDEFFRQLSKIATGEIDLNQFRKNMYAVQSTLSPSQLEQLELSIDLFSSRIRSAVPEAVTRVWQNRRAILSAYDAKSAPTA
jgi:hypothetical protein